MKIAKAWVLSAALWGALSLVASCGGKASVDGTDSHTHWLKECEADSECGDLRCICGVCTKACDEGANCLQFGAETSCEVPKGCDARGPTACVLPTPGGGGGGGSSGGSTSSGGAPAGMDCEAMDAASDGTRCAGIAGYTWNGSVCTAVLCGCAGSECGRIFATADECDRAFRECYAERGIGRSCENHADCMVQTRLCCEPCSTADDPQEILLATSSDSPTLRAAGICLGDQTGGCDDCAPFQHHGVYASCVEGECRLLDVTEQAKCQTVDDCRLVTKDCCDCGGDFSGPGLLAVDASFTGPEYCPADQTCPACVGGVPPDDIRPTCEEAVGTCRVSLLPL
jgi:hypothetical protein